MRRTPARRLAAWWGGAFMVLLVLGRCDTVEPEEDARLVVESFFDADEAPPVVVLRRTAALGAPALTDSAAAVPDADVQVTLAGQGIGYRPIAGRPGAYGADGGGTLAPRTPFAVDVWWRGQHAHAEGTVPLPIEIDSVAVQVPDAPVEAVLLDSLQLGAGSAAQKGFIYPVEVTLWWTVDFAEVGADSLYWVRTQLKPYAAFSSTVVDFFLLPEQILRERTMPRDAANRRYWRGVYAVPVAERTDPLPSHALKVSLLRSGRDYARFASSLDAPERREPVSNVTGGIGIVAGISVDSTRLFVQR